jgi:hypothetical protein
LKNYAFAEENNIKREQLLGRDIMMIGYPQNKALLRHLPDQIAIAPESFVLNEKTYQQSMRRPISNHQMCFLAYLPIPFLKTESRPCFSRCHRIRRKTWPVRSPITANTVTWHLKTGKIGPKDFGR